MNIVARVARYGNSAFLGRMLVLQVPSLRKYSPPPIAFDSLQDFPDLHPRGLRPRTIALGKPGGRLRESGLTVGSFRKFRENAGILCPVFREFP